VAYPLFSREQLNHYTAEMMAKMSEKNCKINKIAKTKIVEKILKKVSKVYKKLLKIALKVAKSWQKVVTKLLLSCQKDGKKLVNNIEKFVNLKNVSTKLQWLKILKRSEEEKEEGEGDL
jgi:hypothetical protein